MKRLCFLSPDVASAHRMVDEFRSVGFDDSHIYVIAAEGTELEDLPESHVQEHDAIPGLERGLALGGSLGLLTGMAVLRFSTLGFLIGGAAIPMLGLLGAGVSGMMGLLAGAALPNSRLSEFQDAIEQGKILLMVDVSKNRISEIENLIRKHHKEVEILGLEPPAPVIPK